MFTRKMLFYASLIMPCIFLCGCGDPYSEDTYTKANANEIQTAELGVVLQVRDVKIINENLKSTVGSGVKAGAKAGVASGAAAGVLLGGRSGKFVDGTVGGAAAGTAIGALVGGLSAAAFANHAKDGKEYVVRILSNNSIVVVSQSGKNVFRPGQHVYVVRSQNKDGGEHGSAKCRIIAAYIGAEASNTYPAAAATVAPTQTPVTSSAAVSA